MCLHVRIQRDHRFKQAHRQMRREAETPFIPPGANRLLEESASLVAATLRAVVPEAAARAAQQRQTKLGGDSA